MSKLSVVRKSLKENQEVIIVQVITHNYLPGMDERLSHTVDFWVAPRNGLYTVDELQAFMMRLVPE